MQRPSTLGRVWPACLVGLCLATAAIAQVPPGKHPPTRAGLRRERSGFDLFATATGAQVVALTGNRVSCNIWDYGNVCMNPYESGTVEGAFWPAGTYDNYVFNGGLQVAATVPTNAGFEWAGDTVGVFFMDPRGDQRQGTTVTGIFDSRNANDLAVWPTAAYTNDPALFVAPLVGRQAISDQDTWVRYWDGNPALSTGRKHMMGMVVDQRSLAWNRPFHQDIVYFIYRLINVTSRLPASYAGLASIGYSAADQQQLAALGAQFQGAAEASDSALQIPDSGYTFHNLYVAYYQDPDVGNTSYNYSTAVLPYSLVAAMKSNYSEPTWQYPLNIFSGAFAAAPGFEAIQLLRGVADSGSGQTRIAVWSNTCDACGLLYDPVGIWQMYRYITGRPSISLGDGLCNSNPIQLHTCAALQAFADTRYFESSGPTDLGPGQSTLLVVAMLYAAPVAQWAATTNGIYAMPAGQLATYQGAANGSTFVPGFPAVAETLAVVGTAGGARVCTTNCTSAGTIREPIERAMGWGQFGDANGDGRIEVGEVQTVPGSLLGKAQVAQALFANKFLLPSAPSAPNFFLIPGDGQVTIAWEKSGTEATGDPYFAVARNPLSPDGTANPLYDPDYRQNDVMGYRIWRGTSASNLQVIAEFDYTGMVFTDYTGQIVDQNFYGNQCAPELGVTASCPTFPVAYPLPSFQNSLVQVPLGGRVLLASGSVAVFQTDTVLFGKAGAEYWGVPFVFTDSPVQNSFAYVYAVTAFDINSIRSGPSSLESPLLTKTTPPRVGSGQETAGSLGATQLLGANGSVLTGTMPTVDTTTLEFSGPMPPTNGIGLGFLAFAPQLVDSGGVTLTVDSIVPADGFDGAAGTYFLTLQSAPGTVHKQVPVLIDLTNAPGSASATYPLLHTAQSKASRYGGDSTFTLYGTLSLGWPGTWDLTNWGRGAANGVTSAHNGPRWWVGSANENTANPNGGVCIPSVSTCGTTTLVPNLALTAGSLGAGVQVMLIEGYATAPSVPLRQLHALTSYLARAADFRVFWGAGGAIDSVVDVTHHVPVSFNPALRASWGILTDSSFTNTNAALTGDQNNGTLTWQDVLCVAPIPSLAGGSMTAAQACGGAAQTPAFLLNHARLAPVVFGSSAFGAAAPAATGTGFIFYIAGQFFLMQMATLPAAGSVWNLRTYAGDIGGVVSGNYSVVSTYASTIRPPAVPGLRVRISYQGTLFTPAVTNAAELAAVHTVPDPYYNHSAYETAGSARQLRFVNLPAQCIIRIYSVSGILVRVLTHNDPTGGGEEPWDVLSREGLLVASGVYFYHIQTQDGRSKVGRFTVVNVTAN